MNKADKDKVIAALEDGMRTCGEDQAAFDALEDSLTIMRGLAEDAEPEAAMIDAAMVAMKGIYPPLRRSECQQLIRAAFNATSPQAAQTEAQEREAFEAKWLELQGRKTDGWGLRRSTEPPQDYVDTTTQYFWELFQAGRAGRKG